jgi:hypothetical protein
MPRGNLLNLRHGLRSKIIRAPYEAKYAARIRDLAADAAEDQPQLVEWLAQSLTTVDLGDQFIAKHGRQALPEWIDRFYRRAVDRVPKLCSRLEVPLDEIRPRMKPKPAKPEPVPVPGTPKLVDRQVKAALAAAPKPSPNPAGEPRYMLREAVIDRLGEMDPAERQEETRVARIYPRAEGPNQIPGEPRYMQHDLAEG